MSKLIKKMDAATEQEIAALDARVRVAMRNGYHISLDSRPNGLASVVVAKKGGKSCLLMLILLCFFILPAIVYAVWPVGEVTREIYINSNGKVRG